MRDIVLESFAAFKKNSEGGKAHLYVDPRGYMTIAIGYMMSSLAEAKKAFKKTKSYWYVLGKPGVTPTEDMIEEDYNACIALDKSMGGNVKAYRFEAVTKLRLTPAGIIALTQKRMKGFEATMYSHITRAQWNDFPADAQFCCIAMMWGPGVWSTVVKHHPKLTAAIKDEDFLEAAKHIDFASNGNDKVRKYLNQANEFLLYNAAASMPRKCRDPNTKKPAYFLNPNLLYWPRKWEYDADSEIALEVDIMPDRI